MMLGRNCMPQKVIKRRGRFTASWKDAVAAEAAVMEQHRVERTYRRMLTLTDNLLNGLERRNLAGQRELDEVMERDIACTLAQLTPEARQRYRGATTVQQALD